MLQEPPQQVHNRHANFRLFPGTDFKTFAFPSQTALRIARNICSSQDGGSTCSQSRKPVKRLHSAHMDPWNGNIPLQLCQRTGITPTDHVNPNFRDNAGIACNRCPTLLVPQCVNRVQTTGSPRRIQPKHQTNNRRKHHRHDPRRDRYHHRPVRTRAH